MQRTKSDRWVLALAIALSAGCGGGEADGSDDDSGSTSSESGDQPGPGPLDDTLGDETSAEETNGSTSVSDESDSGGSETGTPEEPEILSIFGGEFAAGFGPPIHGRALLVRYSDDTTAVSVHVEGLSADTTYPAHVHNLPCDVQQGGGHYKIDPSIEDTLPDNEIWPELVVDADGVARSEITVEHLARPDAQAIVIHDPEDSANRLACADLRPDPTDLATFEGTMAPFAAAEAGDQTIAGTVSMVVETTGTTVTMELEGLDPAADYESHVHMYPCDVAEAGGHYKIDPSIEDTQEFNELWPAIEVQDDGTAVVEFSSFHAARPDAEAVVIHRIAGDESLKVACATLPRVDTPEALTTVGNLEVLPGGFEAGFFGQGDGTMVRGIAGTSTVTIAVNGLQADTTYPVHVHALSCEAEGGPHYKLDPAGPDDETNEIWLELVADGSGSATDDVEVEHLARAEAHSLVVHDAESGTKLACIELARESPF